MFQPFYITHFQEIFGTEPHPADGLGEEAVQTRLAQRRLWIPTALFDYYSLLGYNRIASEQKRLRTIEELDWYGNLLVFMDDGHGIVSWGIHRRDLDDLDPVVWQGVHGEEMDWAPETSTVSQFLVEMWREIV
jgi:hypothetical protein